MQHVLDIHRACASLYFYAFRPWLKIKVTSGLPNTTDRKLQHEMKGQFLTSSYDDELLYKAPVV